MRRALVCAGTAVTLALGAPALAEEKSQAEREREERELGPWKPTEPELLYALGALLGKKAAGFAFSKKELGQVKRGFADAAAGKKLRLARHAGDLDEWGPPVDAFLGKRHNPKTAAEKEKGAKYAAKVAGESEGSVKTDSGLVFVPVAPGDGPSPAASDMVKVNYEGRLVDGTVFDSSARRGGPASFRLNGVIPCWTEGVQRMKVGGKARLVCPSTVAYGDHGRPPQIPAGATLVFDVELLGVEK